MTSFDWEQAPFQPLLAHLAPVRKCIDKVLPMFECVQRQDYEQLRRLGEEVFKAEYEADKVKNELRNTIPKAFALPVFRGDLLAFIHMQDEMADAAEDLAVQLTIKQLTLHEKIAADVIAYVRQVLTVCQKLYEALALLEDVTERDFRGKKGQQALDLVAAAEHEEWRADKLQYKLAKKLFALEDELKATDIFLWSGIFQTLGALANHADKTAERLRRMVAR